MAAAAPPLRLVKREEPRPAEVDETEMGRTISVSPKRAMGCVLPDEALPHGQSQSPRLNLSWDSLDSSLADDSGNFPLPMGKRHWDHSEERASRPGNSRIPGRDHRRYYHYHWRLEYLMDFDARCHSMICMVCGSTLATLKLSTIKRHIHQKHSYSVNWSVKEKEAIITSWDAHLCVDAQSGGAESEGLMDCLPRSPEDPLILDGRKRRRRLSSVTKRSRQSSGRGGKVSQDIGDLDQYLNESLQSWFRMEYMMDYNSERNKLFCMMCGNMLANLSPQDIKQHILHSHPKSLEFSEEEKSIIVGAWNTKKMLERLIKKEGGQEEEKKQEEEKQKEVALEQQDMEVQQVISTTTSHKVEKKLLTRTLMAPPAPSPASPQAAAPISVPAPIPLPSLAPIIVSAPFAILCPVRIPSSGQTPVTLSSVASAPLTVRSIPAPVLVIGPVPALVPPSGPVDLTVNVSEDKRPADAPSCNGQGRSLCSIPKSQQGPGEDITLVDDPEPNMSDMVPTKGRGRDHRRYYQDRWRMDYLMNYNCMSHGLVCMVCGSSLNTMKLSTIKRHIRQKHEHTMFLSNVEKHVILEEWDHKMANLGESEGSFLDPVGDQNIVTAEKDIPVEKQSPVPQDFSGKAIADIPVKTPSPEVSACSTPNVSPSTSASIMDKASCEDIIQPSSWDFCFGKTRGRGRYQRDYYHDRWRLEYMMDYNRNKNGLVCMVCGCSVPTLKLSTIKMHIQQKHPDTTYLSDQEKAVIMEEWTQKMARDDANSTADPDASSKTAKERCMEISDVAPEKPSPCDPLPSKDATNEPMLPASTPSTVALPEVSACSPNSFKNQKRNYQVRWRMEYMMDYDCRQHGLICMVCGGTLATLKVSTIKRHILQVHPYSVEFSPEERQRILDAYSEMAVHYIHSEDCFQKSQHEPVLPHHPEPACSSVASKGSQLSAARNDVIVI